MTTASLIESISVSGYGAAAASGSAYFFRPGTTSQTTVYQDSEAGTAYTQPVVLDSNGRAFVPVFATDAVRMQVFSAGGVLLVDTDQENVVTAAQVAINNAGWSADLADALDAVTASFGTSGALVKMPGATTVSRPLNQKLTDFGVCVTDFGAKGDGRTDDTAAIQAALLYVQGIGSGEVRFPLGTFKISSGLSFNNSSGTLKITGLGKGSVIDYSGAAASIVAIVANTLIVQSISMKSTAAFVPGWDCAVVPNSIFMDCHGLGFTTANGNMLIYGPSASGFSTVVGCTAFNSAGTVTGFLLQSLGTSVSVLGSIGDVKSTSAAAAITIVGSIGAKNNASSSLNSTMTVVGGSGAISTIGTTPYTAGNQYLTTGTDSAVDFQYTIGATSTVTLSSIQGMIILNANVAAITVTYAMNTPGFRTQGPITVCFFNNTAGAVVWTAGGGVTLRGAAPAPGAGAKVYVTFTWDSFTSRWVETART